MLKRWWNKIGVATKLYVVVGIMAALIGLELFTLSFAMTTLSAVRAFVGGEGLWSKSQKSAISNLYRLVITRDARYYVAFTESMQVPMGDHRARLELEKPNMNFDAVSEGFVAGQNHPDDIRKMVNLVRRFHQVPYLARAIDSWREADAMAFQLLELGRQINAEIERGEASRPSEVTAIIEKISALDAKMTVVENQFSYTLGAASRWLEHVLIFILVCAVVTIEGTGLFLTVKFARQLSSDLGEFNAVADSVGKGDFDVRVEARTRDELGRLALSVNKMIENLSDQIKSRQSAEHASEAKNLFLANMSHEIRTPLNAVMGFSELLHSREVSNKEKDQYLEIVKRTGANLMTIIDDILDIARLEAEGIEVHLSTISLREMLSDLQQILRFRSEAKGIELVFSKETNVADDIVCDGMRLRQILINLVGNAIKFTHRGRVEVNYGVRGETLFFRVSDSGVGIAREQIERLFKPFSQGDNSVRKMFGGTGLGLLLSQRLAQHLKGDVRLVKSVKGKGSVFLAEIPYSPSEAQRGARVEASIDDVDLSLLKGLSVLVCEDAQDNRRLIQAYLKLQGVEVDFATNGEEGLEMATAKSYDIVLMDMQMPVMDGFTATRELRSRGFRIPVVALTGYAMKRDQQRCIKVGCDAFIAKPVSRAELYRQIAVLVRRPRGAA
ncbi:MAG: response regulator [Bdellovibrionota bacterium]